MGAQEARRLLQHAQRDVTKVRPLALDVQVQEVPLLQIPGRLAERLQGGGHPNAAGAALPRSVQSIPDAILYLQQILNPADKQPAVLDNLEEVFSQSVPGTEIS